MDGGDPLYRDKWIFDTNQWLQFDLMYIGGKFTTRSGAHNNCHKETGFMET